MQIANRKWWVLLIVGLLVLSFTVGCEKDEDKSDPVGPSEEIDPTENAQLMLEVSVEAGDVVAIAVQNVEDTGEYLNPQEVANSLESIENVEKAQVNEYGTVIHLRLSDGSYTNVLLVSQSSEELWVADNIPDYIGQIAGKPFVTNNLKSFSLITEFPDGGKALILAPYQSELSKDLGNYQSMLEAAGFDVSVYEDSAADLDKFRASYLDDFDFVLIDTHGSASFRTIDGTLTTVLVTGETVSETKNSQLADEGLFNGIATTVGNRYCLTVPFLNGTNGNFDATWIYAAACQTSLNDSGPTSLVEAFLSLGAGAYTGYDGSINSNLNESIIEQMLAQMTSGVAMGDAMDNVLNDWGLQLYAWFLRVILPDEDEGTARVELLDTDQRLVEDYYLFDPDRVIGTCSVIPSHGPVGTHVLYRVDINPVFADNVVNVEFDIDNTGEHIGMVQISELVWEQDELTAPNAEFYPRVDTFTFSAFASDETVLGQGSATFTITGNGGPMPGIYSYANEK